MRQNRLEKTFVYLVGIGNLNVDIGGYIYDPTPVRTIDRRITPAHLNTCRINKRNLRPVRQTQTHILDIRKAVTLIHRVTNHHTNIVTATLNTLRLIAVKTLPNLPCKIGKRQTKHPAVIFQRKLDLNFTRLEAVVNIRHTVILGKFSFEFVHDRKQRIKVAMTHFNIDRLAHMKQGRSKSKRRYPSHLTDLFTPHVSYHRRTNFTLLAAKQFDIHLRQMCAARTAASVVTGTAAAALRHRLNPYVRSYMLKYRRLTLTLIRVYFRANSIGGSFHSLDDFLGLRNTRTLRHLQRRPHIIRIHRRKHRKFYPTAGNISDSTEKYHYRKRKSYIPPGNRFFYKIRKNTVHEFFKPAPDHPLKLRKRARFLTAPKTVTRKVRRKNTKRFDKRKHQNQYYHNRDHPDEFAHDTGDIKQRHKRYHRRQHRHRHRRTHLLNTQYRSL